MTTIDPSYENEILYKENKKLKDKIFNQNKSIKELNITIKGYRIDQEERINQEIKQAERIKELEQEVTRLKTVPMKYRRMEYNAKLQRENTEQAAEISRLKGLIAKCSVALSGMNEWFDAEENHEGTTFYQRVEMCNLVQIQTAEALAAIKE